MLLEILAQTRMLAARCGSAWRWPVAASCAMPWLLCITPAMPGEITLSNAALDKLRKLVQANAEASSPFQALKKKADEALDDQPNPIKTIRSEGLLAGDPLKVKTAESMQDLNKVNALGWAYAVTADSKYAHKAREFLLAWAEVNESRGDPIDDTKLDELFEAYDLTQSVFAETQRRTVEKWIRQVVEAERKSTKGKSNNWQSHRIKLIGLAAYVLQDKELIADAINLYKKQIRENLHADGSSLDFHERDALHYHVYTLDPLLTLAWVAREHGTDLYGYKNPEGAGLEKAVAFLAPYCTGEQTHPEFVNSKVKFDKARAENGQKEYQPGHLFEPKGGAHVLELAAAFNPEFGKVYFKATGRKESAYPTWQFVLNAVHAEILREKP